MQDPRSPRRHLARSLVVLDRASPLLSLGRNYNGLPQAPFDDAAAGAYGAGAFGQGTTGSTALYHHNGTRYGLGLGRTNGDAKMNGIHGPKHKRGDIDRECEYIRALWF